MMQAFQISRYGSVNNLQQVSVPVPVPAGDEVLVKVHCAAINDWDWGILRGMPLFMRLFMGLTRPRIKIAGTEISGVVAEVGAQVTEFQVGDAVYGDLSDCGFGGFAEFVCVRENSLVAKPVSMTFAEAAAMPHAGALARQGLFDIGDLQTGQRLLINGAGGGVGVLALQMAKALKLEVTGVDHGDKFGMLQQIGFDHLLDYTLTDFTRAGERYDLILDTRTTRSPTRFLAALNPGGKYVTVGGDSPRLLQTVVLGGLIKRLTGKQVQVLGLKPNRDLAVLNDLYAAGDLRPVIDGPVAFAQLPAAMQKFGDAGHQGKVIVNVA